MTTTSSVNGSSIPAAGLSNTPANMQINQADFLQLITAQMQDQNPLSPSDPTQFVTQLEGMSQVSAMQSMQSSLQASAIMSGTSLIGRSILAPGTQATLATGGALGGAVEAPAGTTNLTVAVQDSTGATVDTFKVTPAVSGLTSFVWNGATSAGTTAPAGTYTIGVSATVNGTSQTLNPMVVNKVDSVLVDPTTNAVDVETATGTVPLSSIVSVM
ncbi:MAG: flgD [Gammaproteobacteria bacterium]|nr:flgD [Gammaproteobacteria bacterium]